MFNIRPLQKSNVQILGQLTYAMRIIFYIISFFKVFGLLLIYSQNIPWTANLYKKDLLCPNLFS